jgi:hypothetical protein
MILPIKNCYWVLPGKLLAGEYPRNIDDNSSREKINALLDSKITIFIDLTEEREGLKSYSALIGSLAYHRFPIQDVSIPESTNTTLAILNLIDHHIAKGQVVYVHCWGGVGRTGLIIGCWLARHGLGGKLALMRLQELWQDCPKSRFKKSPETSLQEQYILEWEVGT